MERVSTCGFLKLLSLNTHMSFQGQNSLIKKSDSDRKPDCDRISADLLRNICSAEEEGALILASIQEVLSTNEYIAMFGVNTNSFV